MPNLFNERTISGLFAARALSVFIALLHPLVYWRATRRWTRWALRGLYITLLRTGRPGQAPPASAERTIETDLPFEFSCLEQYDEDTRLWLTRILAGELRPVANVDDSEAAHDALRLRGVLGALADLAIRSRPADYLHRAERLLEYVTRESALRPFVGWDTTTAALRLLSILEAQEKLSERGLSLNAAFLSHRFLDAHASVLKAGSAIEPEGNHRCINACGRAALQMLLTGAALQERLARQVSEVFASQLLPDGGHVEHSPHYHLQAMKTVLLIANADRRRGGILHRLLETDLARARQALPIMLAPDLRPLRFSDLARSFSGRQSRSEVIEVLGRAPAAGLGNGVLPDFGIIARRWTAKGMDMALAVDVGPLGMRGNTGHGHSDALSFCFFAAGDEVVIDPGTYLYSDGEIPIWFKKQSAHSTIYWPNREEGRTISRYFRWRLEPPRPVCEESAPLSIVAQVTAGEGSARYLHSRRWEIREDGLSVLDQVKASRTQPAIARLALHPQTRVTTTPSNQLLLTSRAAISICSKSTSDSAATPSQGWYAPRYGVCEASSALEWKLTAGKTAGSLESSFVVQT
jgi:hypothetical protein